MLKIYYYMLYVLYIIIISLLYQYDIIFPSFWKATLNILILICLFTESWNTEILIHALALNTMHIINFLYWQMHGIKKLSIYMSRSYNNSEYLTESFETMNRPDPTRSNHNALCRLISTALWSSFKS